MAATRDQLIATIIVLEAQAKLAEKSGPTLVAALKAVIEDLKEDVRALDGDYSSGDGG